MPYRFSATVTAGQKSGITQDFAAATGWQADVPDPANPGETIPNPITRAKWLDARIDAHVRAVVRDYRLAVARATADQTATIDMQGLEEP